MREYTTTQLTVTTPARYRIHIQGYLDNTWANQLGSITFTNHLSSKDPLVTVLSVQVMDQTELIGVLTHLYSLGLPLISVECLKINA